RGDGLQRPAGDGVDDALDVDERLADGETERRLDGARLALVDEGVVGQADGVTLAEVVDLDPAVGLLLDLDVVLGDVAVVDDAAGDVVALGAPAELDGAG